MLSPDKVMCNKGWSNSQLAAKVLTLFNKKAGATSPTKRATGRVD
jgi:hypothetical protein